MIKYNQLHIPGPCQIHYDSLPYHPEKRPCDSCRKPVYDFRNKDEEYFNKIWKKHNGDLCGAFTYDQFSKKDHPNSKLFTLKSFRTTVFGFVLGFWTMVSKANNDNQINPEKIELNPIDSSNRIISKPFTVMTKDCKTCIDEFEIQLLINGTLYNTYRVKDSSVIVLPSTVKPTDLVTIEGKKRVSRKGWTNVVTKVKRIQFRFEDRNIVEVKATRKTKLRIIYKRDWIGCPKFR
ncbi:MAG: hypothetical protein ACK40G_18315 [Cytophagaceae bacterium]